MSETSNRVKSYSNIMSDHFQADLLKLKKSSEILVSHNGHLNAEDVDNIAFDIEAIMRNDGVKKKYTKAFFSIIVEALQNIRIHGNSETENAVKPCYAIVGKRENTYFLTTCNYIKPAERAKLSQRINYVNNLSPEHLKEYYFKTLSEGSMSKKGGAGLGIITLATKSNNKLEYSITDLKDHNLSLFRITTTLNTMEL